MSPPSRQGGEEDRGAESPDHGNRLSRRALVGAIGSGALVLSGCLGDDDESDDGTDDESGTPESGSDDGSSGDGTGTDDSMTETDTPADSDETDGTGDDGGSDDGTSGGDGGSEDGGDDDGGSDSDEDAALSCPGLTEAGYSRYDEESPFVATFEYTEGGGGMEGVLAEATANDEFSLTIRKNVDGEPVDMFPTQNLSGTPEQTDAQLGTLDGLEVVSEVSFDGEPLPIVKAPPDNADEGATLYTNYPYYVVGLPYEGSEGKQYYRFDLRATVEFADSMDPPACRSTWEEIAVRMAESLEPNPNTTIESE